LYQFHFFISFDFNVGEEEVSYSVKDEEESCEMVEKPKFKMITPVALVHGTYIIGENEDGMFIIDQHAANERINYEYYLKELGKEDIRTTDLLIPIKIELSNNEYIDLKEHFDVLHAMGIDFEEFGHHTLIIRSHPCWIKKDYLTETLRKIIEVIILTGDFSKEKFNEKIAITLACKMSIKANEHISLEEMKALILRLRDTDNPFTCPHGRPTVITYTKYELEKMFKRVM